MFLAARTASVGSMLSVITSDFISEFSTLSTAPFDSTPWVM